LQKLPFFLKISGMANHAIDKLWGRFRGERLAILCCGPSFADLDLEEFRGWHVWAVNATVTALPAWMLAAPRTYWVAAHLPDVYDIPAQYEYRNRVNALPPWRLISHAEYAERFAARCADAYWMPRFAAMEMPHALGSVFGRALFLASRAAFRRVVVAGADMRRQPVPGKTVREWPHYVHPFAWKPKVPYRLKRQREKIAHHAERGRLAGTIELHPTSRWPHPRPFPTARL
jgi:hypothetical protein